MRVTLAAHLHDMSGAVGDLVYVTLSNGTVYARQRPCRRHRKTTEEQLKTRSFTSLASANWSSLTEKHRDGWFEYAKRTMLKDKSGRKVRPNAVAMYVRANMTRQVLGLPLLTQPPTEDAPRRISNMEAIEVADPRTVQLRIFHRLAPDADLSDLVLLVRMAPPPATEARKFLETDFRYICKATAQSGKPMCRSGEEITFTETQFAVPPGKRYMIELRVARLSDGIVSKPYYETFRKPL